MLSYQVFRYNKSFVLECGRELPGYHLAYTVHGTLNSTRDNAVWIFHALTANSDPYEWWQGLTGPGKMLDPARYFIVCVNMPGSCYGSIGPLDPLATGQGPAFHNFPFFTTRDMIRAYQPLRKALGIERIHIGIGGSMGGQQLLEWAVEEPELFEFIFPIATNAQHSPWAIAFNASQRFCIEADETWKLRQVHAGSKGMQIARSMALLSYRHYDTYQQSQAEDNCQKADRFKSESYQRYQGEKLARRFNAFSYYFLSKSMDSHNVGRGRGGVESALQRIKAKTMTVGIETDLLFPLCEQERIARNIPGALYRTIYSLYGHDGFLIECKQIEKCMKELILPEQVESYISA